MNISRRMNTTLTSVPGFKVSGVACDIRGNNDGRLDLALIYSVLPCTGAAVFTCNKLAAAPVRLGREQLARTKLFHGVVVNSGNANACTGKQGLEDAKVMRQLAASGLGCGADAVFVCSTGRIGRPLPMEQVVFGIDQAIADLGTTIDDGFRAADAILTSDTCRKHCSRTFEIDGKLITISGMAKGAGMIEPHMATMLAFITTDASVDSAELQQLLQDCVSKSFNAITVDGDSSTNDTVILLANGHSGVRLTPEDVGWSAFGSALESVCIELGKKIVGDGEKITKVVEIDLIGAANSNDAESAARAIGNSLLVKASWYGEDPNWGRLVDAVGYSGAAVAEDTIHLSYGLDADHWVSVFDKGFVHLENKPLWESIVRQKTFCIRIDLGQGSARFKLWATDLTDGYVNFNRSE